MIPGLLPDEPERQFPWMTIILGLLAVAGLTVGVLAAIKLVDLRKELDGRTAEIDRLREILRKPVPSTPAAAPVPDLSMRVLELEARLARMESERAVEAPASPPERPAEEPEAARDVVVQHIAAGVMEFRTGRYDPAEIRFLQALPASVVHLILTALSRGDFQGAFRFLNLATQSAPDLLLNVKPRDLLGSAEEVQKLVSALEGRVEADPMDVEAKMLLAYVVYHEKGSSYAKALLVDVTQKQPENKPARRFLAAVDSSGHP